MTRSDSRVARAWWFWINGGPLVSYATAIIAFVVCGFIFIENLRVIRTQEQWVSHSHEVLRGLDHTLALVASAEAGQQGYLLVGEPQYLEPFHVAVTSLDGTMSNLEHLMSDNTAQLERLNVVKLLARKRLSQLEANSSVVASGEFDQAIARIRNNVGHAVMAELRSTLKAMANVEEQILKDRRLESEAAYRRALLWGMLSGFLGLSLVLASLVFVNRELQRRRAAESDVRRQSAQIRMLSEVVARLSSVRDSSSLMGTAPHEIRALIPSQLAIVMLELPRPQLSYSTALGDVAPTASQAIANLLRLGAVDSSEPVVLDRDQVQDLQGTQPWPAGLWLDSRGLNLLRVPLLGRSGNRIGTLQLMGKMEGEFNEHDRLITLQFAYALGIALQNAILIQELHRSDHRKDEFLAMLGHELRNPLAGIVTGVEALQQLSNGRGGATSQSDSQSMITVISRQAGHMSRLVDDLLDVSRIARGKISLRRTSVNMREVVEQVIADFRASHAPSRRIDFEDSVRDACWIDGDPTRLAQCLMNLITNAAKFSSPDTIITVVLAKDDEKQLRIDVRDQGVGLATEELSRIFDAFHQVNPAVDRTAGGLGLGLALVKGLARLHGGNVVAYSAGPGTGCTFSLLLPLTPPAVATAETPRPADVAPPSADGAVDGQQPPTSCRIVLIDDRRDSLLPMRLLLSRDGHQVRDASNGMDGLQVAQSFQPEIILCDIGLPGGMNGFDVARAVRSDAQLQQVYMVAISGYGQKQDLDDAADAGFDFHMTKPVSQSDLRLLVSKRPRFKSAYAARGGGQV